MPKISVIIPCFNAAQWICQTMESVSGQQFDDLEVIVVDDGSTDKSAQIIENKYPFARLAKTEKQGPSKARNIGTKLAKGEFLQYLDADDLLAPGKLKTQFEALQKSGADVAHGDWQKFTQAPDGKYVYGKVFERKKMSEINLFTGDAWSPPVCYLFRRSIVEKIGGWNEGLPIIQDARFSLDCALYGGKFVYCEGIMGYYRVPSKDSVSMRDPVGFVRDCLRNAIEIEKWWQERGGINEERRRALVKVYGNITRGSFAKDKQTFEIAYQALFKLDLRYIPERPKHLRLVSKIVGYRRAETIALWYRHIKVFILSMFRIERKVTF